MKGEQSKDAPTALGALIYLIICVFVGVFYLMGAFVVLLGTAAWFLLKTVATGLAIVVIICIAVTANAFTMGS